MITPILYLTLISSDVFQSTSTKLFNRENEEPHAFNFLKSIVALIILLVVSIVDFNFHLPTIYFALAHGLVSASAMYTGFKALSKGPIALSSTLVSFSVIIPLLWGILVRKEEVSLMQYVAIALLILALLSVNLDKFKKGGEKRKTNVSWVIYIALTFIFNGIGSILSKEHQGLYPSLYVKEFTVISLLLCTIIHTLILFITKRGFGLKNIKGKKFGVLAGVCTALMSLFTLVLSATEKASILFPLQSSGKVLGVVLVGYLLFKEKLKVNHYFTVILGLISVILFKI